MKGHQRNRHTIVMDAPASIRMRADAAFHEAERTPTRPQAMEPDPQNDAELDLMISLGWGDTAQCDLPGDWRTRTNPEGIAGWG